MGHDHGHGLTATGRHRGRLIAVLAITLSVMLIQVIGALLSGSLALLADAGHMLSDAAGVFIALMASWIAALPASDLRTYGYQRAEVLAALANALILVVVSAVIFTEAIRRIGSAPDVHTDIMLYAAILGAAANLVSLLILRKAQQESLNVRGAYLEVLGDLLGSVRRHRRCPGHHVHRLPGGGHHRVRAHRADDPAAGLAPAPRGGRCPAGGHPQRRGGQMIREHILSVAGVVAVHDIHIWTITSGVPVFSAHVVVEDAVLSARGADQVLDKLTTCLGSHFDTEHCTFQLEPASHSEHESHQHA